MHGDEYFLPCELEGIFLAILVGDNYLVNVFLTLQKKKKMIHTPAHIKLVSFLSET